jgi:PmbA protein
MCRSALPETDELAERAAERAGDGALALVVRERSLLMRFAANRPTQSTAIDDVTVELAVVREGHVGRAMTNAVDDDALSACARRAAAAAEAAAASGDGTFPGFGAPTGPAAHQGHDPETAELAPERGGEALAAAFEAARDAGLEAHGIWTVAEQERAVASHGAVALDRTTDAFMKVICMTPEGAGSERSAAAMASAERAAGGGAEATWPASAPGAAAESTRPASGAVQAAAAGGGRSGYASETAVSVGRIDGRSLAERAAWKASAAGDPAELEPGEYPVVFEAHAVGWLLDLLAGTAFNGLAHAEGRGALVGRLGDQIASPAIHLSDSPSYVGTLPFGFDAEGVRKTPMPLIQDGVAHGVVYDLRSAKLAGAETTGHALAPGGANYGPHPTNLVLAGGGAKYEDELCAPIERGIYVTRLWYANVVRPRETLITAVTRDGTFLIENGRVTRPLRDLRLTDTVLGILSRAQDLTRTQKLTSDGEFYGRRFASGVACPAMRVGSVRFTGAAG